MLCKSEHHVEKGERQEPLVRAGRGWGCGVDAQGQTPAEGEAGAAKGGGGGPAGSPLPGQSQRIYIHSLIRAS